MNEQNRPEEDNPGTKDTEDVSGYAYRPGPPPITPPGRDPVPPQPVPPGIVPQPDPGLGDYNPGSSSTVTPVNRDGGPDDQEAVQGYMVPGVPLPVSDTAPVPPPPGPDPYEKDPGGEHKPLPPERVPPGVPDEVHGYIASVVPVERMPAPVPDPVEKKQQNDPNSPIAPPTMPPGVGDPASPSALDKKGE